MTVPRARQVPALRRYNLRRSRWPAAGGTLDIVAPRSSEETISAAEADRLARRRAYPYWAEVWPASIGLGRTLLREATWAGARALDLGCGIGVAGVAAGRHGARVHFVDSAPDALAFAAFNAETNGLTEWTTERLDWNHQTVAGAFDHVLLADVTYAVSHFEPVLRHLAECLAPSGVAWVCDPFREVSSEFLVRARGAGFHVAESEFDTGIGSERVRLRLARLHRSPDPRGGS